MLHKSFLQNLIHCQGWKEFPFKLYEYQTRKQKWLEVVAQLYKTAWNSDRNELIIMWVKDHL